MLSVKTFLLFSANFLLFCNLIEHKFTSTAGRTRSLRNKPGSLNEIIQLF